MICSSHHRFPESVGLTTWEILYRCLALRQQILHVWATVDIPRPVTGPWCNVQTASASSSMQVPIHMLRLILLSPTFIMFFDQNEAWAKCDLHEIFFTSKSRPGRRLLFSKCKIWVSIADTLDNDAYELVVLLFLDEVEYTCEEGVGWNNEIKIWESAK